MTDDVDHDPGAIGQLTHDLSALLAGFYQFYINAFPANKGSFSTGAYSPSLRKSGTALGA